MIMISDLTTTIHDKKNKFISFHQCGIEDCAPNHSYGPRVKYHCIIHFVIEGKGQVIINKKKYEVHKGQAFLIPSNVRAYYIADAKNPWKYCWLAFVGMEAEKYCCRVFGDGIFVKNVSCVREIEVQMRKLIGWIFFQGREINDDRLCSEEFYIYTAETMAESFRLNGGMYMLLALLVQEKEKEKIAVDGVGYAEKVKNYIDNYFTEINEVSKIAQIFHLHPNYLTAVFKKQYFISPKKYLLERKIYYANHLLVETNNSIQYIAAACGFSHPSVFGKVYKRYMGVSPGMYRELNQK